mmetsp:Transcript_803/g.1707  ORF Transcript_803/g.1707 Transcript_803/m.1707 type:complete len:283 (-) Transcript_803:155-1003(-)
MKVAVSLHILLSSTFAAARDYEGEDNNIVPQNRRSYSDNKKTFPSDILSNRPKSDSRDLRGGKASKEVTTTVELENNPSQSSAKSGKVKTEALGATMVKLETYFQSRSKSGKGSKSGDSGKIVHPDAFIVAPFSCGGHCIDAAGANNMGELTNAVVPCNGETTQFWLPTEELSTFKIESYEYPGLCIAVNYLEGDDANTIARACQNELFLSLDNCNSTAAEWYFNGGQLISTHCWMRGYSSTLSVAVDSLGTQCESYLIANGQFATSALVKEEIFVFADPYA